MTESADREYTPGLWERGRHYVDRIPRSVAVSPGLVLIGAGFGLSSFAISPGGASLRLFLNGLATAQASLIAIVFAVTILAIQLTANRYTMRIGPIFYRHPVFQITLFAFLLSIGVDLGLLFLQENSTAPLYRSVLYGAVGLAAGNAWLFVLYIRTSITLNTPEGIITAIGEEITPGRFFAQLQDSESPTSPSHPLLPIYSVARRAIDDEEFETAQAAIEHYGQLAADILAEGMDNDVFASLPQDVRRKALEDMFDRHLPDLALRAEEIDESTLVSAAIELQGDLGKTGLGTEFYLVTEPAFRGLVDLSRIDAPVDMEHYRIHPGVWRELGGILVAAAEYPAPRAVDHLIVNMNGLVNRQLGYDFRFDIHPRIITDYLNDLQAVQSAIIEEYSEELTESDFDWFEGFDQGGEEASVVALLRCRDHLFEISGKVLQLLDESERYPVTDGTFRRMWQELAIEAIDAGLPEYGQTLCEAMIELAYIQPLRSERDHHFWTSPLAKVMAESDPDVVQAAFDRILQFEKLEHEQRDGDIAVWGIDDWDIRYHNHLDARFPPLNAHVKFPDRVVEIREHVQERYEELTEEAKDSENGGTETVSDE